MPHPWSYVPCSALSFRPWLRSDYILHSVARLHSSAYPESSGCALVINILRIVSVPSLRCSTPKSVPSLHPRPLPGEVRVSTHTTAFRVATLRSTTTALLTACVCRADTPCALSDLVFQAPHATVSRCSTVAPAKLKGRADRPLVG